MKYTSEIVYYYTSNLLAINIFRERRLEIELNTRPGRSIFEIVRYELRAAISRSADLKRPYNRKLGPISTA